MEDVALGRVSGVPRLMEITPDNVEAACRLTVHRAQEKHSTPVAWSLAEAYAQPEVAWPRLIVEGDEIVGFLMGFFDIVWDPARPDDRRSGLWRLNIAAERQGQGTGASRCRPSATRHVGGARPRLHHVGPGADGPERFYLKLGFQLTGETSEGEVVGVHSTH
ncbi:N-acetyltransferase [Micromonospora sp. M12]